MSLTTQIHDAQLKSLKLENIMEEMLRGTNKQFDLKEDERQYFMNRIWTLKFGDVTSLVLGEAHNLRYSIHPGSDKMYLDLKNVYWFPNIKAEIATYIGKCLTCYKFKIKSQKLSGVHQQLLIQE